MAVLLADQLTELRQEMARNATTVTWTRAQVGAAFQALEDDWDTFLSRANTDIEGASPGVFTLGQKRLILAAFLNQKLRRGV